MSFRELLQAIAMLVPTLVVLIAAAVSMGHSDDRPSLSNDSVASAPRAPYRHARSSFAADAEYDEGQ
ncbi:MAG TPA: hypothetical protein VIS77_04160 [Burkholderiales bacterium]